MRTSIHYPGGEYELFNKLKLLEKYYKTFHWKLLACVMLNFRNAEMFEIICCQNETFSCLLAALTALVFCALSLKFPTTTATY